VDSVTEEATEVALVVASALAREGAIWSDKSSWDLTALNVRRCGFEVSDRLHCYPPLLKPEFRLLSAERRSTLRCKSPLLISFKGD
jgi:hypothetical protein